ncbi:WD repeat-containing protein [Cryptococcus neoformans]|nr:WD repeat-containing protein [Cryptococcus neoformans var. grubii]
MDEETAYELERQKTIAENRALLDSLGLDSAGVSSPFGSSPAPTSNKTKKPKQPKPAAPKKRKAAVVAADEGPRRRSGRIAGLEADGDAFKAKVEEEEKEREILRVVSRKEREQVMDVGKMVEDTLEDEIKDMEKYLQSIAELSNPRTYPAETVSAHEAYADSDTAVPLEVQRLKDAFKDMSLKGNTKVTNERVFSMCVHPEKTKTLVLVGDKYGQLGIWDALGPPMEKPENEDDTSGGMNAKEEDEYQEGRVWRVQAHAKNSISCMKVDPVNGSGLFSTAYDCSLRHLDFSTLQSTELFSFQDEDMLINHFDLLPCAQEAWMVDKNGGISHWDTRESKKESGRRRWVVQEEGRGAKLGGVSVNPLMPHLICTAGNDQHVRIWDTRHLFSISSHPVPVALPATPTATEQGETAPHNTHPTLESDYNTLTSYLASPQGKGPMRAKWQHGKSCSSAYWDPWGRRILTTSYDDHLRVFNVDPLVSSVNDNVSGNGFKPTKVVRHNCQTGRWLTILRAQWSLNMEYMPHFTVGNMKRTLDVVSATGEKIVALWTDDVTAVPTVTASHPNIVDRVVGGNTSGRIQLWSSGDNIYE